ncbi:MAG: hypothetical protein ABIE70_12405 [bacterium]
MTATHDEHQHLLATNDIVLSMIVGRLVWIFSEQFPGEPLATRAIDAKGRVISVDRGGAQKRIDNLVHNQKVTVQFDYKGEKLSVRARLKRSGGGRCQLIFDANAIALTRRCFQRMDVVWPARLAVLPVSSFRADKIAHLRWLQTDTINFSSGGVLIEMSSYLTPDTILLINFEQECLDFPALIAGRVRHCEQRHPGRFLAGIEFIVDEQKLLLLPPMTVRAMPRVVFEYNIKKRTWLDSRVITLLSENETALT